MCLNCLPYFEKCMFCISLKAAAVLISLSGLICTICLIVLTYLNKTGLSSQGSVNYRIWFICIMILWMITFIILFTVWSKLIENETACDVALQIYFWLSVANGAIQLIFCTMLLITSWNNNLTVPIVYIGTTIHVFCEVYTCFFVISIRVGMLLISILAIMTGVISLSAILQNSNMSYQKVQILIAIKNPSDAMKKLNIVVTSGMCCMACVFMFTGLLLLFGTLIDNDGLIQIFVWVTFLNVLLGYILVVAVAFECMAMGTCILSGMDWLSSATFLVCVVGYLCLWIYFISIANSYVMSVNA